ECGPVPGTGTHWGGKGELCQESGFYFPRGTPQQRDAGRLWQRECLSHFVPGELQGGDPEVLRQLPDAGHTGRRRGPSGQNRAGETPQLHEHAQEPNPINLCALSAFAMKLNWNFTAKTLRAQRDSRSFRVSL